MSSGLTSMSRALKQLPGQPPRWKSTHFRGCRVFLTSSYECIVLNCLEGRTVAIFLLLVRQFSFLHPHFLL